MVHSPDPAVESARCRSCKGQQGQHGLNPEKKKKNATSSVLEIP